jgi:hypothetical protein
MITVLDLMAASGVDVSGLPKPAATPNELSTILSIVFAVVGALALLMVVVSGMRYILSAGDPRKAAQAREGIIYALVGVAVAISAEAIISFVLNRVNV